MKGKAEDKVMGARAQRSSFPNKFSIDPKLLNLTQLNDSPEFKLNHSPLAVI